MKSVRLAQIFSSEQGPPRTHSQSYVEDRGHNAGKKDALRWRI